MDLSIFKNPLFIAIVIGIMTYLYLFWENEQTYMKNPKATKQPVGLLTPLVVTLISWFIASYFLGNISFGSTSIENQLIQPQMQPQMQPQIQPLVQPLVPSIGLPVQNGGYKIDNSRFSALSSENMTYHLIGKNNIKLPQTDVFIDVAKL